MGPSAPVGTYSGGVRQRREGRGDFAGDSDRRRQGLVCRCRPLRDPQPTKTAPSGPGSSVISKSDVCYAGPRSRATLPTAWLMNSTRGTRPFPSRSPGSPHAIPTGGSTRWRGPPERGSAKPRPRTPGKPRSCPRATAPRMSRSTNGLCKPARPCRAGARSPAGTAAARDGVRAAATPQGANALLRRRCPTNL